MSINLEVLYGGQYHSKFRYLILVLFFSFCLIPFVIDGVSVNYSFVLLPTCIILLRQVLFKPAEVIILGIITFSIIFVLATFYQIDQYEHFVRRASSFLIFMSIFSFSVIRIDEKMILAFKTAVIIVSGVFSLVSIVSFYELQSAGPVHFGLKGEIGSQRFGFIYLIAFWILLYNSNKINAHKLINLIWIIIIISGLFLTFSRSSMVALFVPLLLFIIVKGRFFLFLSIRKLKQLIFQIVLFLITLWVVLQYFPITFEFYLVSLLNPLLDMSLFESIDIPSSSEGVRFYRIGEIVDYVLLNPFTGSGYLGIWAISETGSGSAHGQLIDVFLRVGIFGFIFYLYLVLCLLLFLWRLDKSLFWGMLSITVYGFFHETFKESQGAFVLAFLIGIYGQHLRNKKIQRIFLNQSKHITA